MTVIQLLQNNSIRPILYYIKLSSSFQGNPDSFHKYTKIDSKFIYESTIANAKLFLIVIKMIYDLSHNDNLSSLSILGEHIL